MNTAAELVRNAQVVIFDCDDTVIATAKTRWHVLIETARSFGVSLTTDTIRRSWGIPFDRLIDVLVPTVGYDEFVGRYRFAIRESIPEPTPGARELLEYLAARSTRMEIVTGGRRDLIVQDLDALGLTTYFEKIHGHEETQFHKPDPRVLDTVVGNLRRSGYALGGLLYIGDSVRDFRVADAQSIEFIGVLSGIESAADFTDAGLPGERLVDDLTHLIPAPDRVRGTDWQRGHHA